MYAMITAECIQLVTDVFTHYEDDPVMTSKLQHVCLQLPALMANLKINHAKKQAQRDQLLAEQSEFVGVFVENNRDYMYCANTAIFFHYDGTDYKVCSEDNIVYLVLSAITRHTHLITAWKRRTKSIIMKQIKQHNILDATPSDNTIRNVVDMLYPTRFKSKYEAVYFLTVIGDNMAGTHNKDTIHYLPPHFKPVLDRFNLFSVGTLGSGILHTIKYKYHQDHAFANCRVLNPLPYPHDIDETLILNLLCVAHHYSRRNTNSDLYLYKYLTGNPKLAEITDHILYLTTHDAAAMTRAFVDEYLQINTSATVFTHSDNYGSISWKNMQYLWKHFLASMKLPSVIFHADLKQSLKQILRNYNAECDSFQGGLCSRHLPKIQAFLYFWENNINYDTIPDTGLNVKAVAEQYQQWIGTKHLPFTMDEFVTIIAFYFPNVTLLV